MISPIYVILLLSLILNIFLRKRILTYINIVVMFILAMMRDITVGTDTLGYALDFQILHHFKDEYKIVHDFEFGFVALIIFFKKFLTEEYLLFVSLLFIPFMCGSLKFIKDYRVSFPLALFFVYTWDFYFQSFNIMRQMMVIGFMLMSISLLKQMKYFKYAIVIVITSLLFHKSGIIMLLLIPLHYWVNSKNFFPKKGVLYLILAGSFLLFFIGKTFMQDLFVPIVMMFDKSSLQYVLGMENEELGWLYNLGLTLISCFVVHFYRRSHMNFELLVYVFGICFYNILGMFSSVAPRLALYWVIFAIILFPSILDEIKIRNEKKRYLIFFAGLFIYSIYRFFDAYYINNYGEVNPFLFR